MRTSILQLFIILIIQSCSCQQGKNLLIEKEAPSSNPPLPSSDKNPTNLIIEEMTYGPITHQLTCILKNSDTQPLGKDEIITIFWEIHPEQAEIVNLENKPIQSFVAKVNQLDPQQEIRVTLGSLNFNKLTEVTIKSWVAVQHGSQTSKSGELIRKYQSPSQNIQEVKLELVPAGPVLLSNQDKNISFQVRQQGQLIDHESVQVKITTYSATAATKDQQGKAITLIDKPNLNQPITLQLEANGEQKVQITLQICYKGTAMGQPILYNYLSSQEKAASPQEKALIYFKYNQDDFQQSLDKLRTNLGAKEYHEKDLPTYPKGSIIVWFESLGTRLNHYLPQTTKGILEKSKANVIFVRMHDSMAKNFDDDSMNIEFTQLSTSEQNCVVSKGQLQTKVDNTGNTGGLGYTLQLVDEAGLEKEIRKAISSIQTS